MQLHSLRATLWHLTADEKLYSPDWEDRYLALRCNCGGLERVLWSPCSLTLLNAPHCSW